MTRVCQLGENGVKYKDDFRAKKIQTLRLKTTLSGQKRLTFSVPRQANIETAVKNFCNNRLFKVLILM